MIKHLAVLDRAGREVRYTVRPERLGAAAADLAALAEVWDRRLAAIKALAEGGEN